MAEIVELLSYADRVHTLHQESKQLIRDIDEIESVLFSSGSTETVDDAQEKLAEAEEALYVIIFDTWLSG